MVERRDLVGDVMPIEIRGRFGLGEGRGDVVPVEVEYVLWLV